MTRSGTDDTGSPGGVTPSAEDRDRRRLAEALRANLQRRKSQTRSRLAKEKGRDATEGTPPDPTGTTGR